MEPWEAIASKKEYEDLTIKKVPVPVYNADNYATGFQKCKENLCGHYNTNWGCNPGGMRNVEEYYKGIDYVILIHRTFEADWKDKELMVSISNDMQRTVRRMVIELRDNGVECDGYMDGPCTYCGECAYPDPCRFPDMIIPSVSVLGIGLEDYFKSFGESFKFEQGKVTLYGFIFVKKSA